MLLCIHIYKKKRWKTMMIYPLVCHIFPFNFSRRSSIGLNIFFFKNILNLLMYFSNELNFFYFSFENFKKIKFLIYRFKMIFDAGDERASRPTMEIGFFPLHFFFFFFSSTFRSRFSII